MTGLILEADMIAAIKTHMIAAGFQQCDLEELVGPRADVLWPKIRSLIIGECEVRPFEIIIKGSNGKKHALVRRGNQLLFKGEDIELVRCCDVANTYGALRNKFVRDPPAAIMKVLAKNPHMMPPSWRRRYSEKARWIIFMDTYRKRVGTVRGIYMREGDPVDIGSWDATDGCSFDRNDFMAVFAQ